MGIFGLRYLQGSHSVLHGPVRHRVLSKTRVHQEQFLSLKTSTIRDTRYSLLAARYSLLADRYSLLATNPIVWIHPYRLIPTIRQARKPPALSRMYSHGPGASGEKGELAHLPCRLAPINISSQSIKCSPFPTQCVNVEAGKHPDIL
jgi:hypothetical protein